MAYITKAEVQAKTAALKAINKKYGMSATFSGSNSSTLTLTISKGNIDFFESMIQHHENKSHGRFDYYDEIKKSGYTQVNHFYLDSNFEGKALEYLQEVYALMLQGHWDDSDIQTDYFSCAWYNAILIGKWNKPYVLVK